MKIYIDYNGKTYESIDFKPEDVKNFQNWIYDNIENLNRFKMDLKGGGKMVVGKGVIQNCVMIFK